MQSFWEAPSSLDRSAWMTSRASRTGARGCEDGPQARAAALLRSGARPESGTPSGGSRPRPRESERGPDQDTAEGSVPLAEDTGPEPRAGTDPPAGAEPRVRAPTENPSTPATPTTGLSARCREGRAHRSVQTAAASAPGCESLERRRPLDRLVGGEVVNRARHDRDERVGICRGADEQAARLAELPPREVHRHRRHLHDVLVVNVADDADDAARLGLGLDAGAAVEPQVSVDGFAPGKSRCATLWMTMATDSVSGRSSSVKSRPATIGTPSTAKNRGETGRNMQVGFSSPLAGGTPRTRNGACRRSKFVAPGTTIRRRRPPHPAARRSAAWLPGKKLSVRFAAARALEAGRRRQT